MKMDQACLAVARGNLLIEAERSHRVALGQSDPRIIKTLAEYADELERRAAAIAHNRNSS